MRWLVFGGELRRREGNCVGGWMEVFEVARVGWEGREEGEVLVALVTRYPHWGVLYCSSTTVLGMCVQTNTSGI